MLDHLGPFSEAHGGPIMAQNSTNMAQNINKMALHDPKCPYMTPSGPKTLPMGILHDIVSCWITLGPFHNGLWIAGISRGGSGFYCRGTLVARFYALNFIIIIFATLIIILVCRGYSFGFVTEGVKNPSNGWFLAKLMEKGVPHPP